MDKHVHSAAGWLAVASGRMSHLELTMAVVCGNFCASVCLFLGHACPNGPMSMRFPGQ